jgi:hypothetical protein
MKFEPFGMATAIGSMPHTDPVKAVQIMIESLPEAPAWPQLSKIDYKENMYIQYSRNMPGVLVDKENENMIIDPANLESLENFYAKFLDEDVDYFALGEDYAAGFYAYLKKIESMNIKPPVLKGHVTGPISFGLTVKQPNGQSILYNENYFDAVLKTLKLKAKYQVEQFKKISPNSIPLIFFDEPYLVSFGSAFVSLNKEDVIAKLNECFDFVDGLTGIHVCGGTDWDMVMETNVDIIHFDAFDYFKSMTAYPAQLKAFLEKGGNIGWGITPHTAKVMEFTPEDLFDLLNTRFDALVELGLSKEKLLKSSWIAPSCGTALMTPEQSETALKLSASITGLIRE